MSVGGGFAHTGGTFDPNGGRVVLDNQSNQTLATTFYDLVINDGLLGYWKLDEGTGTTTADSSGYGHDGTLQNGPTWSTDTPATMDFSDPYTLSFDGNNDQVDIGTGFVRPETAFTYALWFQPGSAWSSGSGRKDLLYGQSYARPALIFDREGDGKIGLYTNIGGSDQNNLKTATISWTSGTWYHIAFTWNGSQVIVYVNGAQEEAPYRVPGSHAASSGMHIGGHSGSYVDGHIDDVRVYNRALSSDEISDLATGAHPNTSQATTTLGAALDVNGDLTLNSGTLDVSGSNYAINLAGDLTRNGGVFTAQGGTVTFDGSGTQTLDTDAIAFYDLTVSSSSTLVDLAEFSVDGTLTNNGTLQKTQDVNDSSPVSFFNTGGYGGLTLNANGSDLGSTQVSIKGNQDCTNVSGETVKRCFDIAPANTSGRNATVTFYFANSELSGNTCSTLNAYHWDGSSWDLLNKDSSNCAAEPYLLVVTGVSDFSPFVLKSGGPTAITLLSFQARAAGKDLTGFRNLPGLWLSGLGMVAALAVIVGTLLLRARRWRSSKRP